MTPPAAAQLARFPDSYAAETTFNATWDPGVDHEYLTDRAASAAALAVLVLAAHGREHTGSAPWCDTEACRAAAAISSGGIYP